MKLSDFTFRQYSDGQWTCVDGPVSSEYLVTTCSDLETILKTGLAVSYIRQRNCMVNLLVTGLIGMRSDRSFDGSSVDIDVYGGFVDSFGADLVTIFEPHSDATLKRIRNSVPVNAQWKIEEDLVVFPDAGANARYGDGKRKAIVGRKTRKLQGVFIDIDTTGVEGKSVAIVDDLCDGGRTFINIALQLKEAGAAKVVLYVAHGLFTYGLNVLFTSGIDFVHTTDSLGIVYEQHPQLKVHPTEDVA